MKKIIFYACFLIITLVIEIFNWLGFLCDELFFWNYKKTDIKEPLFIIGMPRSATTFLFNTLKEDENRFTEMKLWEIILAPSVTQKKILVFISGIDRKLNWFLSRTLKKWEKKLFDRFENIHSISLFNVEEDEYILLHILSCALMVFIFPQWKNIHSLIRFDIEVSGKRKQRILTYYKNCIRKHKYVFGPDKTYLSKSPSHTSKIESLKKTFPDCKLIYLLRFPEQTISSAIGMYKVYNRIFFTGVGLQVLAEQTMNFADIWFANLEKLETWTDESTVIIKFEDMVRNPYHVINSVYQRFGYQINNEFENRLKLITRQSASYSSPHRHSPEEQGLNPLEIRERYRKVYEKYYSDKI